MNAAYEFFQANVVVELIGWTLVHFLWQAIIVWMFVVLLASLIQKSNARLRYQVFSFGMLLMLACPLVTFYYFYLGDGFANLPIVDNVTTTTLPTGFSQGNNLVDFIAQPKIANSIGLAAEVPSSPVASTMDTAGFLRKSLPWMVWFWVGGVLLHLVRLVAGFVRVQRWKLNAIEMDDGRLLELFETLKQQMRIRSAKLMQTDDLGVSAVIGIWKPVVLIPASMIAGLSLKELELVLAHELAHVQRWDFCVNVIQKVVESLLFFHPAVWWLSKRMSQEREHCCDDVAAEVCGDRLALAKALTAMETIRCQKDLALAVNGGDLSKRIQRLLLPESQPARSAWPVGIVLTTLTMVFCWALLPNFSDVALADTPEFVDARTEQVVNAYPSSPGGSESIKGLPIASESLKGELTKDRKKGKIIDVPRHIGFYGLNKTGQTKFDVVRIDVVDMGIGKVKYLADSVKEKTSEQEHGEFGDLHKSITKVESNDGKLKRIALNAIDVGRSPTELIRHFAMLIEKHGSPERMDSITNMESIVSAHQVERTGNSIVSKRIVFSLPEGSKARASLIDKDLVKFRQEYQANKEIEKSFICEKVQWIDSVGVIRAVATPVEASDKLKVATNINNDEVVMEIVCWSEKTKTEQTGSVQVDLNLDTGAPKNEGQSPHGSVRYEIFDQDPNEDKPLRMKMMWRYDVARLAKEAEAESGKSWEEIIWGDDFENDNDDEDEQQDAPDTLPKFGWEVSVFSTKHISAKEAEIAIKKILKNESGDLALRIKAVSKEAVPILTVYGPRTLLDKIKGWLAEIDRPDHSEKPWRVFGKVVDQLGQPLSGVGVKAHCGMGTLFETGSDLTGADGSFDFRFGPGIFGNKKIVQAATISVSMDGHVEENLHRQGGLVAAFEKPTGEIGWGASEAELFLPWKPIELTFVMVKAISFKGSVIDQDGKRKAGLKLSLKGENQPPSQSGVAFATTDEHGGYVFSGVPAGYEYQILVRPAERGSPWLAWATSPMKFIHGENDDLHIEYSEDGKSLDFSSNRLDLHLQGEGENWKAALKNASQRSLKLNWDGVSVGNNIRARSTWVSLGEKPKS